jgi:hypothetical protein
LSGNPKAPHVRAAAVNAIFGLLLKMVSAKSDGEFCDTGRNEKAQITIITPTVSSSGMAVCWKLKIVPIALL